jgi:hypothetical protein
MFKVSLADVDRLLAFPVDGAAKEPCCQQKCSPSSALLTPTIVAVLLQMGASDGRPLGQAEIEVSRIVFGRERKGSVVTKVQPFKGVFQDEAAVDKVCRETKTETEGEGDS